MSKLRNVTAVDPDPGFWLNPNPDTDLDILYEKSDKNLYSNFFDPQLFHILLYVELHKENTRHCCGSGAF
jgi:hypothetical protein